MYWAEALSLQSEDSALTAQFKPLFELLKTNEQKIVEELTLVQGAPVDMGGYYKPNVEKTRKAMRPSATFNAALATLNV